MGDDANGTWSPEQLQRHIESTEHQQGVRVPPIGDEKRGDRPSDKHSAKRCPVCDSRPHNCLCKRPAAQPSDEDPPGAVWTCERGHKHSGPEVTPCPFSDDNLAPAGVDPKCNGCGQRYNDPAWIEAVVSDEQWAIIATDTAEILCIKCMAERAVTLGVEVQVIITAGPLRTATQAKPDEMPDWVSHDRLAGREGGQ